MSSIPPVQVFSNILKKKNNLKKSLIILGSWVADHQPLLSNFPANTNCDRYKILWYTLLTQPVIFWDIVKPQTLQYLLTASHFHTLGF